MIQVNNKNFQWVLAALLFTAVILSSATISVYAAAPLDVALKGSIVGFGGKQWHVIGYNGTGVASEKDSMTLLAKDSFYTTKFDADGSSNHYSGSNLQTSMTAAYNGLSSQEQELVIARDLEGGATYNDGSERVSGEAVADASFWPLSVREAYLLDATVHPYRSSKHWWLRSPGSNDTRGAVVSENGGVDGNGLNISYDRGIRPAFKLDLTSVIFSSGAIEGKPSTVGSLTTAGSSAEVVKLTVKNNEQTLNVIATEAQATQTGSNIYFSYEDATTGTNQYVSCVLTDQDDVVKYYGKLADSSSTASGKLSIPLSGVADGTYTLKLFSEQNNGDNFTDFASIPVEMKIMVSNASGRINDFGGTVLSDNAGLVSIAGQSITAGAEEGTSSAPRTTTVTVVKSVSSISASDIIAAEGARLSLYSDSGFTTEEGVSLDMGSENHLYIKVTAESGAILYYDVTVVRGKPPVTPTLTMIDIKTTLTAGDEKDGQSVATASVGGFSGSPIGYSISEGTLPSGLGLNPSTGEITVTAAADLVPGLTTTVTIQAEHDQELATAVLIITVRPGSPTESPTITVAPTILSFGPVRTGSTYSIFLTIDGLNLTKDMVYAVSGSSDGFSLDASLWNEVSGGTLQVTFHPTQEKSYAGVIEFTSSGASPVTVILSGSGYASGGSHSGRNNSDYSAKTTIIVAPVAQPDQPSLGIIRGKVAGTNKQATFTVAGSTVKTALKKAQADAKNLKRTDFGVGARVELDTPSTAELTVTLERTALEHLVNGGSKSFELAGTPISLAFDRQALSELQKQSTGDVTIQVTPVTVPDVRHAYDIRIGFMKDGKSATVTSLGAGSVSLSIPYTPAKGEALRYLDAVYVDRDGKISYISESAYDTSSGSMVLRTNHFSVYGVGYTLPSKKFSDIESHWAKGFIDYVVGRGLFVGNGENKFNADTAITRGDFVTALGRLAAVDLQEYTKSSFTDVKNDSSYFPYVEWSYRNGIVQGIDNRHFAPDQAISRQDAAVILQNYATVTGYKLPNLGNGVNFVDVSNIGSLYKTAVSAVQQSGLMEGKSNDHFNPTGWTTRGEASAILYRYIKLTIDPATAQGWVENDAGQHLYYKNGKPLTDTQTIEGIPYFFYSKGILKTGWVKDDTGDWRFYFGSRGIIGWWDIDTDGKNNRYYFDTNGKLILGKWLQIEDKWYYFNTDGSLARSTKIDGHEVDANGVRKDEVSH
ncbi:hypothetical protein Ami103574_06840 [Aminipila butyrica]|uniref:SLH domain-containing protein n=1 Tax=Aminipila butyrica TaxID=433296 RepID=A0A858BSV2_9FIRM|nr:S-layer homology domain-containing protein [Aminipila butyrica]QIB69061.1 hypothetical protein Ami103574_06840 [Aminipila butyrica]